MTNEPPVSGEPPRAFWRWLVVAAAAAFGVATIVSGGRVLLGGSSAREAAGAYVPFVVVFNFVAGFAYVAAAAGLALRRRWSVGLAGAIAATTVLAFAAFGAHVATGGAFERRTVVAMAFRSAFWIAFAAAGRRLLG
jgi:hypothetical protein